MKRSLFYFIQFTWGLPVNFFSGIVYLFFKIKRFRQERFYNAFITYVPTVKHKGAMAAGIFIYISSANSDVSNTGLEILIHEYGHVLQTLILGPLYWIVIGLPSIVWARFFENYRDRREVSYYSLYCEAWANRLGKNNVGKTAANDF